MAVDVEKIIQCIKEGDQDGVQMQLDNYNTEYAQCFFFNVEERERRKQRELEEFRRNKVRDHVPDSDSDFGSGDEDSDNTDRILRRRLAEALIWFIRTRLQPGVLSACLRTLRILSRDRQALAPFVTDSAILTLAHLGGITTLPAPHSEEEEKTEKEERAPNTSSGSINDTQRLPDPNIDTWFDAPNTQPVREQCEPGGIHGVLARGKKDTRDEEEGGGKCYDDREVWRKEAMKALCNVIYNSQRAQERASALRLLPGLSEKLKDGIHSPLPPSGQFYDLRLLFLLTALRPELRRQLQQERGVSMLTAALEKCLETRWTDTFEVLTDPTSPPVSKEVSQLAIEILKILFNISYSLHRQEPDEEDAALFRRLAAVLRHCMLLICEGEDLTEELQRGGVAQADELCTFASLCWSRVSVPSWLGIHIFASLYWQTVNVLSALPLQCLDVLVSTRLSAGSKESGGVNMDCVHSLTLFMERRVDQGHKLKERLTPVLNLLTESCRAHRETRHYLRQQILPPLREVALRPEQGDTIRNKLVRLMTHVDTELKHCAAELLFVLCKENVSRFVKYTGYGNAAGLLAARGLLSGRSLSPQPQYSSDSDSDTEEYRQARDRINLVTGRVEEPQPDPMEGMSEEEKEAEAVRLISMFNRLSRDKIIQPMLVNSDGRLVPLCGQMRNSTLEEEDEEEEEEAGSEEEVD